MFINLFEWRKFFSGKLEKKKKINFINLFGEEEEKIIF